MIRVGGSNGEWCLWLVLVVFGVNRKMGISLGVYH
jgi:hypothetical protein